jgi:archaemetzincin
MKKKKSKTMLPLGLIPMGQLGDLAVHIVAAHLQTFLDTHVFGEAEVGGRVAVVSIFRLRKNQDGSNTPMDRYYERLAKVALHEVGHTLSIYHCEHPRCLMRYSPGVRHLDEVALFFCRRCKFLLREYFKQAHP